MPERGESGSRESRSREVTATRPARKWVLRELSGILSPWMAFWELEQKRAHAEDDWEAEQAATLNLMRYGLRLNKAGLLPTWWSRQVTAGKVPADFLSAAVAIAFAWRVAQCLFAGRTPKPRQLQDLERCCAAREQALTSRQQHDEKIAKQLSELARRGYRELAALAQELPSRHRSDMFAAWWRAVFWVWLIAQSPAGLRRHLCQRFRLCLDCGCVIVLRKRTGQTRRFCNRYCRRRHAGKKPAP